MDDRYTPYWFLIRAVRQSYLVHLQLILLLGNPALCFSLLELLSSGSNA